MVNTEKSIIIIGDSDLVIGFKAVGVEALITNTLEEGIKAVEDIYKDKENRDKYAIVFISEDIATAFSDRIRDIKARYPYPILTIVPGKFGPTGAAEETISRMIERAIGFDISSLK